MYNLREPLFSYVSFITMTEKKLKKPSYRSMASLPKALCDIFAKHCFLTYGTCHFRIKLSFFL